MKRKHISGSVTIEATLALTVFILGYLCIISLVYAVRAESTVQYGIDRAASEISRYCYAAERLSLTQYIQKAGMTVGEAVENIGGFTNPGKASSGCDSSSGNRISEMAAALSGGACISGIAGEPFFRAVFSGCIAENRTEADRVLTELAGITAGDIDFHYSSVLRDGKTVEIVAVYKVKLKTFGLFGKKGISLKMKNTAVSSAWVTGERNNVSGNSSSKWSLSSFERGKAWVAEIKSENSRDAVKGGKGIDLCKTGKYTMINSVNVFARTYSECSTGESDNPEDYSLNEAAFCKTLGGFASELLRCIREKGSSLQYENGIHVPDWSSSASAELIIVVPSEAGESASLKNALVRAADTVCAQTGVSVRYEFREKVFSDKTEVKA